MTIYPASLSAEERFALQQLASSGAPSEWGDAGRASDILFAMDHGILPTPERAEWFMRRFRSKPAPPAAQWYSRLAMLARGESWPGEGDKEEREVLQRCVRAALDKVNELEAELERRNAAARLQRAQQGDEVAVLKSGDPGRVDPP